MNHFHQSYFILIRLENKFLFNNYSNRGVTGDGAGGLKFLSQKALHGSQNNILSMESHQIPSEISKLPAAPLIFSKVWLRPRCPEGSVQITNDSIHFMIIL